VRAKLIIVILALCACVGTVIYFFTINISTTNNSIVQEIEKPFYKDARGTKGKATIGDGENIIDDFTRDRKKDEK